MKTVLCYGDSNTFGYNPKTGYRFEYQKRWPGILAYLLKGKVKVIEEGLNHRTTVLDDPFNEGRNGLSGLGPCLESHRPLDLVILMLGSNDMKAHYNACPELIARGVERLVERVGHVSWQPYCDVPEILILPPPLPGALSGFATLFEGIEKKISKLSELYCRLAEEKRCWFLNTQSFLRCPDTDGIHLDESGHKLLGEAVYGFLREKWPDLKRGEA